MSQPTPFVRGYNFTDYQAANPSAPLPGYRVDVELDGIAETLRETLGNLALIQRDDGSLATGCVTIDAISPALLYAIAAAAPPGPAGDKGDKGDTGPAGQSPIFTVQSNTLAPGAAATALISGIYPNLLLTLGIPKGNPAAPGAATLDDAVYGDVTVSSAGTIFQVTHVLGGYVPSVVGHGHSITEIVGLGDALNAKQPVGNYAAAAHTHVLADLPLAIQGDAWGGLVYSDPVSGIAEVGLALDFHSPSADGVDKRARLLLTSSGGLWGLAVDSDLGFLVNGIAVSVQGHTHAIADVVGLQTALNGKQAAGSYATTAQLAQKADAITVVAPFNFDLPINDATQNGQYLVHTGATPHTVTFGTPPAGVASILVNRATANLTIACPNGYYKNGTAEATANLTLAPGGKLTAFHEGGGVWAFDGSGF